MISVTECTKYISPNTKKVILSVTSLLTATSICSWILFVSLSAAIICRISDVGNLDCNTANSFSYNTLSSCSGTLYSTVRWMVTCADRSALISLNASNIPSWSVIYTLCASCGMFAPELMFFIA